MSAPEYDPYAMTGELIAEPPQSLWQALRKIGPGIILAGSIVGSGELILTTSLGADYGYVFLWLILFSCVIKVFVQIELGRYAISSGLPTLTALDALPGLRMGAHWLCWWWFIMLCFSILQLGGMTGSVGQALNEGIPAVSQSVLALCESIHPSLADVIRNKPEIPWAFLTCLTAILLLRTGGYRRVETLTTWLVASVTFITLSCVLALFATPFAPKLDELFSGMWPQLPQVDDVNVAIGVAFAAFGITGVGASELYSYPYWCLEKGYARFAGPREESEAWVRRAQGWLRVLYLDAWFSMLVFTVATVAFYVMGAAVLHPQNLHPKGQAMISTLAKMYVGPFGEWTRVVFLIGAGATLFKTLYVSAASHSRLITDFFKLNRWIEVPTPAVRTRWIQRLCIAIPVIALLLFLGFSEPRSMVAAGGMAQAATLPIISGVALFFRYRRTDPRLAPSRLSDVCLWLAAISISIVALYSVRIQFGELIKNLLP